MSRDIGVRLELVPGSVNSAIIMTLAQLQLPPNYTCFFDLLRGTVASASVFRGRRTNLRRSERQNRDDRDERVVLASRAATLLMYEQGCCVGVRARRAQHVSGAPNCCFAPANNCCTFLRSSGLWTKRGLIDCSPCSIIHGRCQLTTVKSGGSDAVSSWNAASLCAANRSRSVFSTSR